MASLPGNAEKKDGPSPWPGPGSARLGAAGWDWADWTCVGLGKLLRHAEPEIVRDTRPQAVITAFPLGEIGLPRSQSPHAGGAGQKAPGQPYTGQKAPASRHQPESRAARPSGGAGSNLARRLLGQPISPVWKSYSKTSREAAHSMTVPSTRSDSSSLSCSLMRSRKCASAGSWQALAPGCAGCGRPRHLGQQSLLEEGLPSRGALHPRSLDPGRSGGCRRHPAVPGPAG